MRFSIGRAIVVISLLAACATPAFAQDIPLSDIFIRLEWRPPGCGCYGECIRYKVTILGTGEAEYDGVGEVDGVRTRTISVDDVVSLVNEFLRARFLQALDSYDFTSFVERRGNNVALFGRGGTGPKVSLTLRLGEQQKTVLLGHDVPADLRRLVAAIDLIAGPKVWLGKR